MDTTRNYSGSGTLACYFRDPAQAEKAVDELSRMGIPKKDIGIAVSDVESNKTAGWTDRLRNMFTPGERDGLGLWISKQIIEKHGGVLHFHSRADELHRGTAFSLVLPAAAEDRYSAMAASTVAAG